MKLMLKGITLKLDLRILSFSERAIIKKVAFTNLQKYAPQRHIKKIHPKKISPADLHFAGDL